MNVLDDAPIKRLTFRVGGHGAQNIVVVAEARTDDPAGLRKAITRHVADAIGEPPKEIALVQPGTVPKTSSGKLQRSACKAQHAAGELALLGAN